MTRSLNALLTATRTAKIALNDARDDLDTKVRRNRDDKHLCSDAQVAAAWDRVEAQMADYRAAKAAYRAACAA
jgi:hypothetical protein